MFLRLPTYLSLSLPAPTTTHHVLTYLIFLVLSSISLLVFLNSTISFVVTDILDIRKGKHGKNILGNIVGTLGLVDEIMVILSAPMWGVISDRWKAGGRKGVSALGFGIAAAGMMGLVSVGIVKGRNGRGKGIQLEGWEWWYWLVVWRAIFAVGGGAISTMISAVLPDLTSPPQRSQYTNPIYTVFAPPQPHQPGTVPTPPLLSPPPTPPLATPSPGMSHQTAAPSPAAKLAGIVGLFSGLGALLALCVFLPLPTFLDPSPSRPNDDPPTPPTSTGEGLKRTYHVVATYALVCGLACWFGLPHYPREGSTLGERRRERVRRDSLGSGGADHIGRSVAVRLWERVTRRRVARADAGEEERLLGTAALERGQDGVDADKEPSALSMLSRALKVGYERWDTIGISYLGGFIARASSVALSLFIPLFVNHYFISHGLCDPHGPNDPLDKERMKKECHRAYTLAATLTGTSQFVALLAAPVIGYLSSPVSPTPPHHHPFLSHTTPVPPAPPIAALKVLAATSLLGTIGFVGFGLLETPELGAASVTCSALLGIGQIGAVVGSLGLLGRGQEGLRPGAQYSAAGHDGDDNISGRHIRTTVSHEENDEDDHEDDHDQASIHSSSSESSASASEIALPFPHTNISNLKGSIAGLYSLSGGVGILLLTKGGGMLFDRWNPGAPFWALGGCMAALGCVAAWEACRGRRRPE